MEGFVVSMTLIFSDSGLHAVLDFEVFADLVAQVIGNLGA